MMVTYECTGHVEREGKRYRCSWYGVFDKLVDGKCPICGGEVRVQRPIESAALAEARGESLRDCGGSPRTGWGACDGRSR